MHACVGNKWERCRKELQGRYRVNSQLG